MLNRMRPFTGIAISLFFVGASLAPSAYCWGPIGHRMVAETAAVLLQKDPDQPWGEILSKNRFQLGYYSTVPDILFRANDGSKGKKEGPTHYFDVDVVFGTNEITQEIRKLASEFPLEYAKAKKILEAKHGSGAMERIGTAPWRVAQFERMARKKLSGIHSLEGDYLRGSDAPGAAGTVYQALYFMGLVAHYTADSTMPYHASSDWNGWKSGQGGIHFYFETDCVNALEPGLSAAVLREARRNQKRWLKEWNAVSAAPDSAQVERVLLNVYLDSSNALLRLKKLDRKKVVLEPSAIPSPSDPKKAEPAHRRKPVEGCRTLHDLLVEQLAKGTVLTAWVWDSLLPKSADLTKARGLEFSDLEVKPDFIPPQY